MLVDATGSSGKVTGAIRQAAQMTGANFNYLLATARVESRLNPGAQAPTSSASGLFQFIEQTWLSTMKQAGPTFGYGNYAAAITRTESGAYTVSDPGMRREILALRKDPAANAVMAGVFTRQNAAKLGNQLGRAASEGELYIAHFLGPTGATRLISAATERPGTRAADLFPTGARANRSIFYDKAGNARSAAQVYEVLVGRYQTARAAPVAPTAPIAPAAAVAATKTPQPVRAATVMLPDLMGAGSQVTPARKPVADDRPVFHALFSTGERREAVAPGINQLWTGPSRAAAVHPADSVANAFDALEPARPNMRALFTTGS
jgi:hypothetical protein